MKVFEIVNKTEYEKYMKDLNEAIHRGNVEAFMEKEKFLGIELKGREEYFNDWELSTPYYDEISIKSVAGWNSPDSTIKEDNWSRVVNSVKYIVENKCMPIAVIKLPNDNDNDKYYIQDGKHRFYAHLLLRRGKIPVSIRKAIPKSNPKENMINYNIPFYNCGSTEIAYPEKVEEFIDDYIKVENLIKSIDKSIDQITESINDFNSDITDNLHKQLLKLEELNTK